MKCLSKCLLCFRKCQNACRSPQSWGGGEVPSLVGCTALQRAVFNLLYKKMPDRMPATWGEREFPLVGFTALQRAVFSCSVLGKFTMLHQNVFYYCTGTYYCKYCQFNSSLQILN